VRRDEGRRRRREGTPRICPPSTCFVHHAPDRHSTKCHL
jgi:hypothetical protein